MKLHEIVGDKMPKVSIMPKHKNYCKCPDCVRAIADKGFLEELNDIDIPTAMVDEVWNFVIGNSTLVHKDIRQVESLDLAKALSEKFIIIKRGE